MRTLKFLKSACFILFWIFPSVVSADDNTWKNPLGGLFREAANWNPAGPPGAIDRAIFDLPETYMVTYDDNHTNDRLWIEGGDVTFDLGGYRYDLEYNLPGDDSVLLGHLLSGKLTVLNGIVCSRSTTLGRNPGAAGELVVSNGGWWEALKPDNWQPIWIGHCGTGSLTVESGGLVRQGHGASAIQPGSQAFITVRDNSSQWYVDGWFGMGGAGRSSLTATGEGFVRMGRCEMAIDRGSMTTARIENEAEWRLISFWETSLSIGYRGSATLELANSGRLINEGDLSVASFPGSYGRLALSEASADIWGSMSVGGQLDSPGGTGAVEVVSNSLLMVGEEETDRLTIWPLGAVHLEVGSSIEVIDNIGNILDMIVHGKLTGGGMIWANVRNATGTVSPGAGITGEGAEKWLEIGGDYTQSGLATLAIEISGPQENLDYGKLYVSNGGLARLGGMMRVTLADGYTPTDSDVFRIVDAPDGIEGVFVNALATYTFSGGTFDVEYTPTEVWLRNYRPEPACLVPPPADLNGDCRVNLLDWAIFANQWLSCGLYPPSECWPK